MQCINDVVFPIIQSTFDSFVLLVFYTLVDRYSVPKARFSWVPFVDIQALDSYVEKHFVSLFLSLLQCNIVLLILVSEL